MALSRVRQQELVSIWKPVLGKLSSGVYTRYTVEFHITKGLSETLGTKNSYEMDKLLPKKLWLAGVEGMRGGLTLTNADLLAGHYSHKGYKAIATAIRRAWYEILLEAEPGL